MNTIEQAREVARKLRDDYVGNMNLFEEGADTIDALIAELEQYKVDLDEQMLDNAELKEEINALKSQEPETYYRHFDGGTQDYPSKSTVPLYLAAGAQPAPKQEPTQPGYQLVPVEPTEGMVIKFAQIFNVSNQSGTFRPAYKAMLAAAKE